MSKSNAFESDMLKHIFQNAAIALIGDASGLQPSAAAGSLYFSLHTADPGEAGDQSTSEISYTGYARVGVGRNGTNFTESGGAISLAANVDFGKRTDAASATATFFGIGTSASGAGKLLYSGALTTSIVVTQNTIPRIEAGQVVTED